MVLFDNIIEDYSPKKTENKKTKAKNYYQTIKKNYKKDCASIIQIFLKMGKLKKNANITNISMWDADRERKEI